MLNKKRKVMLLKKNSPGRRHGRNGFIVHLRFAFEERDSPRHQNAARQELIFFPLTTSAKKSPRFSKATTKAISNATKMRFV